jgi:hypothetical protein
MMMRVLVLGAAGCAAVAGWVGFRTARNAHEHWGIDPDLSARALPGDDLVERPDATDTRVIDIDASVDQVWPWLVQMGYGRGGWYSYDVFDMDEPSALGVEERWQSLAVGDLQCPRHRCLPLADRPG